MVRIVFEKINRILISQAGLTHDEHCGEKHIQLKFTPLISCAAVQSFPLLAQAISDLIEGWL
jgi:hypothetical protein